MEYTICQIPFFEWDELECIQATSMPMQRLEISTATLSTQWVQFTNLSFKAIENLAIVT